MQELIRQKGLSAKPELPGPASPAGASPPLRRPREGPICPLGNYRGKWLNTKGTDFDVEMGLTRQGDVVRGSYNFGVGNATIEGTVSNNTLFYNWKWGTESYGKGVLKPDASGRELVGTCGLYPGRLRSRHMDGAAPTSPRLRSLGRPGSGMFPVAGDAQKGDGPAS